MKKSADASLAQRESEVKVFRVVILTNGRVEKHIFM